MKLTYTELMLIGGLFLAANNIPLGDWIKLAATSCGM